MTCREPSPRHATRTSTPCTRITIPTSPSKTVVKPTCTPQPHPAPAPTRTQQPHPHQYVLHPHHPHHPPQPPRHPPTVTDNSHRTATATGTAHSTAEPQGSTGTTTAVGPHRPRHGTAPRRTALVRRVRGVGGGACYGVCVGGRVGVEWWVGRRSPDRTSLQQPPEKRLHLTGC